MTDLAEFKPSPGLPCRVFWGSHGCRHPRGHAPEIPHECDCCDCGDSHPDAGENALCVAKPPYYGLATHFYGEDAKILGLPLVTDFYIR